MSKLSPEELRKIVEEQLPGRRIVERPRGQDAAPTPASDAVTPDLATLRHKYFGDAAGPDRGAALARVAAADETPAAAAADADDAIVYVVPDTGRDERDRGPGPKAVVVSRATGKVVGLQG